MSSSSSPLSFIQEVFLVVVTCFSSCCSILGSSCIVYIIFYGRRPLSTFKRIMLGMSLCDILNSFWLCWQGFLVPWATSSRPLAIGNNTTCSMLGFFYQLGLSPIFYSGALSYYYLLTIRYGMGEDRMQRHVEPWFHGISIGFPLVSAIAVAIVGAYHEIELGMGCWITHYPPGCESKDPTKPYYPCTSNAIGWCVGGMPFLLIFFSLLVNNILIYGKVRSVMIRGGRRSSSSAQTLRTHKVATQSYLYVLAVLVPIVLTLVIRPLDAQNIIGVADFPKLYSIILLNQFLFPLQGLFNFLVFLRPRYHRYRTRFPEESVLWAVKSVLLAEMGQHPAPTAHAGSSDLRQAEPDRSPKPPEQLKDESDTDR